MTITGLATTIDEIHAKFDHFQTDEGKAVGDAFIPESTDIIISPYPKSGTTWTQQIVHSLRTQGDMDFGEITEVVPWISMSYDLGIDLTTPQKAHPRAFKSHHKWDDIPKGARYIISIRNPKDVVVSDYRFLGDWIFDTSLINISEFAKAFPLKDDDYWTHLESWWSQYDNPDVLFLCFEDMKADLIGTIRQVATFMQIPLDDELLAIVEQHASFDFMKAHQSQFDDHLIRQHRNEAMGLPLTATTTKVQDGKVGSHKTQLPPDLITYIESRWQTAINPDYGLTSYDVVREKIRQRHLNA